MQIYYNKGAFSDIIVRLHQVAAHALTSAAAVASVLWMMWRMMACRMRDCGGCCDGRGVTRGFRVGGCVCESARTVGWNQGTVECPGLAGLVWCMSS